MAAYFWLPSTLFFGSPCLLLIRQSTSHAPNPTATTPKVTPTPIPAVAAFESEPELLELLIPDVEDGTCEVGLKELAVTGSVLPEEVKCVAAGTMLKPFTCIPYTIVGPVEVAVDAGTTVVATPQGPDGVVD